MKLLLGGQPMNVNIKHQAAQLMKPPPVLMLSNDDNIFNMEQTIWNSRIKHVPVKCYETKYDDNEEKHMRLYPLCWIALFEEFLNYKFE